jgi:hypothetical protein
MTGYVVTRPYPESNIGSNLASLAGALWLAHRLGRDLVVDWRGMSQLRNRSINYFTEFFEAPAHMLGVPVRYAPEADSLGYEEAERTEPGEAHLIGTGQLPVPDRPIVLTTYHGADRLHPGPAVERFAFLRSFYRCIVAVTEIRSEVNNWWADNLDGAFVVGVNVRTGNGMYFGRGMHFENRVDISLFDDARRFLRKLEGACRDQARRLSPSDPAGFHIFYATDSKDMSELLSALPNSATRRRVFPPPGTGDTYVFEDSEYTDRDSVVDTLTDMFLLAQCDALVFNSSMFNQYARVLNGNFGGNMAHIETLYVRWHARRALAALGRRLRAATPHPTRGRTKRTARLSG